MKESRYDKHVFIACLIIFLYSFFIVGAEEVTREDLLEEYYSSGNIPPATLRDMPEGEVVAIKYPTSIYLAPIICIMYLFFMAFPDELRPIDRHWMKKKLRGFRIAFKNKMREGLEGYREWKKS